MNEGGLRGNSPINKLFYFFLYLVIPSVLAFSVNVSTPLFDSFHEGEYLGNIYSIKTYYNSGLNFPVLIHGAMDYIPSLLSIIIMDSDHVIVWTRFLNTLAVALCWIMWFDLSRVILRRHADKYAWNLLFILLFFLMFNTNPDPVVRQQSFLGTRDLFLLLSVWSATRSLLINGLRIPCLLLFSSGIFAALSFYWSYDRGIISAAWTTSLCFSFVFLGRWKSALSIIFGYVASLFIVSKSGIMGSFIENYTNVIYWIKYTGDVWYMPIKIKLPALPGCLAIAMLSITVMFNSIFRIAQREIEKTIPAIIGLIFVQIIFLTKLYKVPAFPLGYWYVWPSILILILSPPKSLIMNITNTAIAQYIKELNDGWDKIKKQEKLICASFLVLSFLLFLNPMVKGLLVNGLYVVKNILKPVADNKLINLKQYGFDELKKHNFDSIFQWSNEGIFSFMSKKPFYSKYGYAVYISKDNESNLLAELRSVPPDLIVYDSPYWSMNIWGRSMRDRLPNIDQFIIDNYNFHKGEGGYIFATPKIKARP